MEWNKFWLKDKLINRIQKDKEEDLEMKRNKWKSWGYDCKYTSVRRRIKRKTNKRERFLARCYIRKCLREEE